MQQVVVAHYELCCLLGIRSAEAEMSVPDIYLITAYIVALIAQLPFLLLTPSMNPRRVQLGFQGRACKYPELCVRSFSKHQYCASVLEVERTSKTQCIRAARPRFIWHLAHTSVSSGPQVRFTPIYLAAKSIQYDSSHNHFYLSGIISPVHILRKQFCLPVQTSCSCSPGNLIEAIAIA
jgi:hypothetical protein